MQATEARRRFRAVLDGETCVHPGSVYDAMTSRMAVSLGYEVGILAGSVASLAVLAAPDEVVMTLSELADQCRRICRAAPLPLLVDADHGFGNALNVMRTVEELETAGVAALSIEDTELPKGFDQAEKLGLRPLEEGIGKMKAAMAARQDPSLVIAARTSAPQVAGIDETIGRLKAYQATGVDALFVVGLREEKDLAAVAEAVDLPLILAHPGEALDKPELLARHKVRVCLQPHLPIQAAMQAAYDTLKAMREGAAPSGLKSADKEVVATVTRKDDYADRTKRFLRSG